MPSIVNWTFPANMKVFRAIKQKLKYILNNPNWYITENYFKQIKSSTNMNRNLGWA